MKHHVESDLRHAAERFEATAGNRTPSTAVALSDGTLLTFERSNGKTYRVRIRGAHHADKRRKVDSAG